MMKCPECGEVEEFTITAHVHAVVRDLCFQQQIFKFMNGGWDIYDCNTLECNAITSKVTSVTYETGCCGAFLTDEQVMVLGCTVTEVN